MSSNLNSYKFTPLDVVNEENVRRRTPFVKPIKLNFIFPTSGKAFSLYRKLLKHINDITPFFSVLDEYELFTIETAITNGTVPDFFLDVIKLYRRAKKENAIVEEVIYGQGQKMPLFTYDDRAKLDKYHTNPPVKSAATLVPKNLSGLMSGIKLDTEMFNQLRNLRK